jgi:hypothetical protein
MSSFMPLPMMAQVVLAPGLPANIKRDLALAVWTRAVLLDDFSTAKSMADAVAPFFPQVADNWKSYRNAADADARKVEAALVLLKLPAARPYRPIRIRCSAGGLSGEGRGREKTGEQACKRKKTAGHRVVSVVLSGVIHVHPFARCRSRDGGRRKLGGSRKGGRQRLADRELHRRDLLLLGNDNLLGKTLELLAFPEAQNSQRHVDSALMMWHHHRHEIAVYVAGRCDHHVGHHLVHRGAVRREEIRLVVSCGPGRSGPGKSVLLRGRRRRTLLRSGRPDSRDPECGAGECGYQMHGLLRQFIMLPPSDLLWSRTA